MIKFNKIYFTMSMLLFLLEVGIYFTHGFIRHTLGDYFVVILLYCFVKSFWVISVQKAAIIVLITSFIIEFLQLSNLQHFYPSDFSVLCRILLGTSFSIGDLMAYTLGIITVVGIEKYLKYRNKKAAY